MRHALLAAIALSLSAPSAFAQGDAEAGAQAFNQCQTCHVVENEDGEVLAGRTGRQGPNLYGVIGRQAGTYEDFRYRDSIVEAGEQGLVWDEENLVAYLQDPTSFLRETLDDPRARSGMSFRARNEEMAQDIVAFLATFGPEDEEGSD